MKNPRNIFVIPARGGSKRFPGKNLGLLDGIPLISHSINYAKANSFISSDIIVSTDDHEIKNLALRNGVRVIDRPENLSTDTSSTVSALNHVLDNVETGFDNVILLQPTNPLRPEGLLREAYSAFIEGHHDSLMTVTQMEKKLGKIIDGHFHPINYQMGQRSQDLESLYYENGLLYIINSKLIKKEKILGEHNLPYVVNHPFANVDIDYKEDIELADFLLTKEKKR